MSNGGKRIGAGRKKIGSIINIRIQDELLLEIEKYFTGNSRAEKIRKCLVKGLDKKHGEN